MKRIRFLSLVIAAVFISVPVMVAARESETTDDSNTSTGQMTEAEKKAAELRAEAAKKLQEQQQEAAKKKMEERREAFKKACENRRENFKDRMENVAEKSKKRWETADKIVERVKAFVVKKNLTVPNYDQLLADVAAKRQVLEATHEQAKEAIPSFSCEKDEVKSSISDFKAAVAKENEARKAYKDAIKALIQAVKTAAEAAQPEANDD